MKALDRKLLRDLRLMWSQAKGSRASPADFGGNRLSTSESI